jgi:beta-glucanase (GH16 family)
MKMIRYSPLYLLLPLIVFACSEPKESQKDSEYQEADIVEVVVEAEDFVDSSSKFERVEGDITYVEITDEGWLALDVTFDIAGRYRTQVMVSSESDGSTIWLEDYIDNKDGRTYNVTGEIKIAQNSNFDGFYVEGSPFNSNLHKMKLHAPQGGVMVDKVVFTLMKEHQQTPQTLIQNMEGDEWKLVWSDEFDGPEVDTSKWIYDFGNWGWGNNELQYYTDARTENARLEDGNLVIEARKNDMGEKWTSARLTTRGKVSFLYGRIEMKAKVPKEKGNWAAGWTLGDSYVDELSWPYCGEIDILESVGYEVDNETGDGIAHISAHTPAYYFKKNNQVTSIKEIKNIAGEYHTYSVEWTPTEIRGYVDGEQYYLYDKIDSEQEWPFAQPQTLILNLAMGGGWGGLQGMDESVTSQKFILDYIRVYELN